MAFCIGEIPEYLGYYLAGFTDGEGSFHVVFRPRKDYVQPWKVSLCFNISQREEQILRLVQRTLKCGTMRQRADGVWYFEVNGLEEIIGNVIPFFNRFHFISEKKKRDFGKFKELSRIIAARDHLSRSGIEAILDIREDMNDGGKRRYDNLAILEAFEK